MYIDTVPNCGSNPAILIRESYREGGKVRKRTIANISKLSEHVIKHIWAALHSDFAAATDGGFGGILKIS